MSTVTIVLRGQTAKALDTLVYAPQPETGIQLVAQHLLAEGLNSELPVGIQENGWHVAHIPTLQAAADPSTFTPDLVRKLNPHRERKQTAKRSNSLFQSA